MGENLDEKVEELLNSSIDGIDKLECGTKERAQAIEDAMIVYREVKDQRKFEYDTERNYAKDEAEQANEDRRIAMAEANAKKERIIKVGTTVAETATTTGVTVWAVKFLSKLELSGVYPVLTSWKHVLPNIFKRRK